jgi:hypothetical protein
METFFYLIDCSTNYVGNTFRLECIVIIEQKILGERPCLMVKNLKLTKSYVGAELSTFLLDTSGLLLICSREEWWISDVEIGKRKEVLENSYHTISSAPQMSRGLSSEKLPAHVIRSADH